ARRLAGATHDELSRYSGASYGTRAVAYLRATVDDNAVGLTALRALVARDLAALVAYTPGHAYKKLLKKAPGVKRGRLSELPLEERLAVALGRVLKDARGRPELKLLVEAFERGDVRVEKTEKEGEYVIYAGGKTAVLELIRTGGAQLSGDLVKPLAARKEDEVRRAVERYEEMWKKGVAPLPSRAAVGGWLLSDISVKKTKKVRRVEMETASLEQAVTFLSAFGVRAGEIHWGRGKRREKKPVKIYIDYFDVTGEGLKPVYCVELYDRYAKEVLDRLRSAPAMYEEERKAIVDFITRRLDRKVLERLGTSLEEFRQRLERWLGEWPYRAPKITRWDKDSRVFHTLLDIFRELARGECDAEVHEEARRHAVETLLHAVLGDGSVKTNEVVLYVGKGKEMSAGDKAALYYALLRELGYQPKITRAENAVHIRLSGEEAGKFAREALPFLVGLERLLEFVKSDEQIYSKVVKLIDMARAERVEARVEALKKGRTLRAKLVVEADGVAAEYPIYLRNNTVVLFFNTINREEAERRAALLRAVGVRAEVGKHYDKSLNCDVWSIHIAVNSLAAESVHGAVRRAVVEFLKLCREAGAIEEKTYRRLAAKFERGVPEWGEVRFSVELTKNGAVNVWYQPSDPQSFTKAVNFLRELGLRDRCEGDWCIVHFTAREPEGGSQGFVRITVDGLRYIGWLALHGDERAQRLKEMLLKEAEAKGREVRQRLMQYFREGEMWGSVKPPIEKEVEVEGRRLKVRVEEVEAWTERSER
ncbi:MAG: PaRep2b protein, partial [Pyrobaculum sp.]